MQKILQIALATLLACVASTTALAQQPTFHDALLDHMVGKWLVEGDVQGKKSTQDVTAEWVIEHQYLKIHEVSHEKKLNGEPEYEATVFIGWNDATAEYSCVWLDVYGSITTESLGHAKKAGDTLPFLFKAHDGDVHTTFAYIAKNDTWTWTLDNEKNGKLVPFARFTLTRAK
jgi:hypothetical protein